MRRIDRLRLTAWRWMRWGRRLLALALIAAAAVVASAERAGSGPSEPAVEVLVAGRNLAAGAVVAAGDLLVRPWPTRLLPEGTLRPGDDPVGRLLVGPVRAGEAVTDVRLLGPGLVQALDPGTRAVPVRLTDAGVGTLLRAGDRIDLYAVGADAGQGTLVAARALVLLVPAQPDGVLPEGGIIVVAVPQALTAELVAAAYTRAIAATLAPP